MLNHQFITTFAVFVFVVLCFGQVPCRSNKWQKLLQGFYGDSLITECLLTEADTVA